MIPKIIWQTHENKRTNLPSFMQEISDTWINLNPGYKYIYLNANERKEYVNSYLPEIMHLYNSISKPHQADIWRYIALYNEGGIYADMDSICTTSIDTLLNGLYKNHELVCTDIFLDDLGIPRVNNANFACTKKSNIMKNVIDSILTKNIPNITGIGPENFSNEVLKNKNLVLFAMSLAAVHGESFKNGLERLSSKNTYIVNYMGNFTTYDNVLEFGAK